MKIQLFPLFRWFIGSGWITLILFCLIVPLSHYLIFTPADIRGRNDYRKFPIAFQNESVPEKIAFCTFELGPPREIDLKSKCSTNNDADPVTLGSLLMKLPSGQVPMVKEAPDYGWTRYTVLSDDGNSQLIETENYYNSDSLVTRYRVTGMHVEPVGQIFATRGLNQMFVFLLPVLLLLSRFLASIFRVLANRILSPHETRMSAEK